MNVINNLLDFSGNKEIQDLEINSPSLEKRKAIGPNLSISGEVDVLCTTKSGQKIAVEMQGKKTIYFLAREQEYMAKLISGQVKEREGEKYHKSILDTYMIIIAKENIFVGSTALKCQDTYEIDVLPTVQQTQEVCPGNKMHWKFFELSKFSKHPDSENIHKNSPLKLQWLDFLLSCAKQENIPENRDKIIQESYQVMDMMSWDPDVRTLLWRHRTKKEDSEMTSRAEGKAEGKAETILGLIQQGADDKMLLGANKGYLDCEKLKK